MANEKNLFPHNNFPFRLEYMEGNDKKICWFESQNHLDKHITRYKLDKRTLKIDCRDEQPTQSSKTNKAKVRQGTGKSSNGSSGTSRKNTKSVDASGNSGSTSKPKPKRKPK